jgi:hypothetical protein
MSCKDLSTSVCAPSQALANREPMVSLITLANFRQAHSRHFSPDVYLDKRESCEQFLPFLEKISEKPSTFHSWLSYYYLAECEIDNEFTPC